MNKEQFDKAFMKNMFDIDVIEIIKIIPMIFISILIFAGSEIYKLGIDNLCYTWMWLVLMSLLVGALIYNVLKLNGFVIFGGLTLMVGALVHNPELFKVNITYMIIMTGIWVMRNIFNESQKSKENKK